MLSKIYNKNKIAYLELVKIDNSDQIGGKIDKHHSNKKPYRSISRVANQLSPDTIYILKDIKLEKDYRDAIFDLFPREEGVNRSLLKVNKVGLYSMTKPNDAKIMLDIMEKYIQPKYYTMINATSGIGGEIINMYTKFKYIHAYELDKMQYDLLEHNVSVYGITNVNLINEDFTKHLNDHQKHNISKYVVMVDPPWGGLDYKKEDSIELKLGEYSMPDLASNIEADLIIFKLPKNHNLGGFYKFKYDTYDVANYILVIINKQFT